MAASSANGLPFIRAAGVVKPGSQLDLCMYKRYEVARGPAVTCQWCMPNYWGDSSIPRRGIALLCCAAIGLNGGSRARGTKRPVGQEHPAGGIL